MALNEDLDVKNLPNAARDGLRQPRVVTLEEGEVLFRFASTDRPNNLWAASPWWMYERDYRKIVQAHEESELSMGLLGRSAVAIQPSFSRADVVVKARVLQDIKAFCGLPRTQYRELLPNGMWLTLRGWAHVEQLFIPNISGPHGRTPLGYQALSVMRQKIVTSQQLSR
jgi:hypothetical protein